MKVYRFGFILIFCVSFLEGTAQNKPNFLPDLFIDNALELTNCYCDLDLDLTSPGRMINFSYELGGEGQFEDPSKTTEDYTIFQSRRIAQLGLNIPIIRSKNFKLFAGYSFGPDTYKIKDFGEDELNLIQRLEGSLITTEFQLTGIHSFKERWYAIGKIQQYYSGGMSSAIDLKNEFSSTVGTVIVGYQLNEKQVLGGGLRYAKDAKGNHVLPIVFYKNKFASNWSFEVIFPYSIYLKSYRNANTIVSIGADYKSRLYNITYTDDFTERIFAFNNSAIKGTVMIEKRLAKRFWFNSKIGYQSNFDTEFESLNANPDYKLRQTATPFFELALFFSIPNFPKNKS